MPDNSEVVEDSCLDFGTESANSKRKYRTIADDLAVLFLRKINKSTDELTEKTTRGINFFQLCHERGRQFKKAGVQIFFTNDRVPGINRYIS